MGLDCTAYSHVSLMEGVVINEDDWFDLLDVDGEPLQWTAFHGNPEVFEDRADGLKRGVYRFEEEMGWRAGSYGGYNNWRRAIAELGGYTTDGAFDGLIEPDRPFIQLVCFSDCEGIIGPKTSAKLHADFVANDERAQGILCSYDYDLYKTWTEAFRIASQNGFVAFH